MGTLSQFRQILSCNNSRTTRRKLERKASKSVPKLPNEDVRWLIIDEVKQTFVLTTGTAGEAGKQLLLGKVQEGTIPLFLP